jgi:serine/threonine protein kinase
MSTEAAHWVGQVLGGRYQVHAKLGEGGMGLVYRAHDHHLGCDVVLKAPHPDLFEDPGFAARFSREIRSLVRLVHPHIVKITDVGEHEGLPFAVMQYLSGGSLRDRQPCDAAGNAQPMPPADLADWLEDVAAALDFIHAQHFVHRDIKPDNILFDAHGHAYISDFGVIKALLDQRPLGEQSLLPVATFLRTGEGQLVGTPAYMAPELGAEGPYDGKVDQYALAVTLYEWLCGRVPFDGPNAALLVALHRTQKIRPLHDVVPGASPALSAALLKAMAKDPNERYPNCLSFARAVLAAISSPTSGPAQVIITCPSCGRYLKAPAVRTKRFRCSGCDGVIEPLTGPLPPPVRRAVPTTVCPADAGARPTGFRSVNELIQPALSSLLPRGLGVDRDDAPPLRPPTKLRPKRKKRRKRLWRALAGGTLLLLVGALGVWLVLGSGRPKAPEEPVGEMHTQPTQPALQDGPLKPSEDRVGEVRRFEGPTEEIWTVAYSPDGHMVLSGGSDRSVRLWDVQSGQQICSLGGYDKSVWSVAFSPDNLFALSGSEDWTLQLWDIKSRKQLHRFAHAGEVNGVAFCSDPDRIYSVGRDDTCRIWNRRTGKEIGPGVGGRVVGYAFAVSRKGDRILYLADRNVVGLWDTIRGQSLHIMRDHAPGTDVYTLAFSPDESYGASGGADGILRLWDLKSGKLVRRFKGHAGAIFSAAFSPDGRRMVSGGADTIVHLWDVETGKEIHPFKGHTLEVRGVAFSPDGKYAVSGSFDKTLRLWRLPD